MTAAVVGGGVACAAGLAFLCVRRRRTDYYGSAGSDHSGGGGGGEARPAWDSGLATMRRQGLGSADSKAKARAESMSSLLENDEHGQLRHVLTSGKREVSQAASHTSLSTVEEADERGQLGQRYAPPSPPQQASLLTPGNLAAHNSRQPK